MQRIRIPTSFVRLLALSALLAGCEPATAPPVAQAPDMTPAAEPGPTAEQAAWEALVESYIEDFLAAHPAFAVAQGRHEYDGMLPDWTAERGGRAAWRDFHDRFLSFGGPPIPLVRARMLGEGR